MPNNPSHQTQSLPLLISGPILRRVSSQSVAFWLVTKQHTFLQLELLPTGMESQEWSSERLERMSKRIRLAEHAHLLLIEIKLSKPLPLDTWIGYRFQLQDHSGWHDVQTLAPGLCYPNQKTPGFVIHSRVRNLLHGSCRKPHFPAADGLVRADEQLANSQPSEWPALLMMSGDQIYVDDVSAPMLMLMHHIIQTLGFTNEPLPETDVPDSDSLHKIDPHYFDRESLLPKASGAQKCVFAGAHKPIFTSVNAQNHLVSLAEIITMYLLIWSPSLWQHFRETLNTLKPFTNWPEKNRQHFTDEKLTLNQFAEDLPRVRRLLAHLPSAMIFDDHDITDDWNLTAQWEYDAYGHPLSKRIIGNALIAYWFCQGWGNAPERFPVNWLNTTELLLTHFDPSLHNQFINELIHFRSWSYRWDTKPRMIVLDTRTHRWRSDKLHKPSGLMDFESLIDLQQELEHENSVLLVSPAPMFGVKLIESIQKLFTFINHPLVVDAENWMAHRGSATTLLNIFQDKRTPQQFVILSGDVHYSFVYDIKLRRGDSGQELWQITSSGIKNEFPKRLMDWFDRLNRWMFTTWSPMNWLTQRRNLKVIPRKPEGAKPGQRLINQAGIGSISLDEQGVPIAVKQLCSNGQTIAFKIKS